MADSDLVANFTFTGALPWTNDAACQGQTELFFAPPGERPETRARRETHAGEICAACPVLAQCREWAREHREYGFWGGESEEARAAAGYRVEMPVGRVARYPKGNGAPVAPRATKSSEPAVA
ncbi:MAG: WhiB family transcriptional regulator [Acidimicrobiia bacterium]